jgi:dTDP-4-dehydrorhamnose 3,5-epimerase
VAVDVRVGSPTYGKHVARYLSAQNKHQMYVPPGFAHGFCVTSDEAIFTYKCTQYYDPSADLSIAYNDPLFGIAWPIEAPVLSKKDTEAKRLAEISPERLMQFGGTP